MSFERLKTPHLGDGSERQLLAASRTIGKFHHRRLWVGSDPSSHREAVVQLDRDDCRGRSAGVCLLQPPRSPAMSAVPSSRPLAARPRMRPSDCCVSETVSPRACRHRPQSVQSRRFGQAAKTSATVKGCWTPARRTQTRVDPPRTEGRCRTSIEGGNRGDRHRWLFKAPKLW